VAEDVAAQPVTREERARASAYYTRFTLAYTLLGMVAAGALATLVVLLVRSGAAPKEDWSTFQPTGSPIAKARQIAIHVSSEYRSSTGGRLVTVLASPLQTTRFLQSDSGQISVEVPISSLAVEADASSGKHEEGDFTAYDAGSSVAYQMCGFGSTQQDCGIVSGVTEGRGQLLRREALELALYTLKYVPGTQTVLTYLPSSGSAQTPDTAVLVVRKDVKSSLEDPLARTITPRRIVLGETLDDGAKVDDLTLSRLYTYDYQTLPGDGTAILVLTSAISGQ
jgi:hypothetical protein